MKKLSHSCPLLIDVLRLLPVQPFKERDVLGTARFEAVRHGAGEVHGISVPLEDLGELFLDAEPGGPRVSSKGARLLLDLLRRGVLETDNRTESQDEIQLVLAYAEGRASIVGPGFWAKRRGKKRPEPKAEPVKRVQAAVSRPMHTHFRYPVTVHRLT